MKLLNRSGEEIPVRTLSSCRSLAIYPGSFNPLHEGHKGIYDMLSKDRYHVVFELSRSRYQKSAYTESEIAALSAQFKGFAELLITDAPLFSQKRDLLRQYDPCWIMGYDTAKRWIDENRSADPEEWKRIAKMKVILVGRLINGVYYDPHDLLTGQEPFYYTIYHYRNDISSTQIREDSRK